MASETANTNSAQKNSTFYWIHCNNCFEMYTRKSKSIFLLSCQHTACSSCTKQHGESGTQRKSVTYKCPVCGKIVRGRELGNNMPSHVKELFHPKPWLDEIFNAQILDFQIRQRQHFVHGFIYPLHKHFKRMLEKQEFLRNRSKQTFEQLEIQRQERKHLESRVRLVIATRAKREQLNNVSRISNFSNPCANSTELKSNSSFTSQNQSQFMNGIKSFGRGCLPPQTKEVSGNSSIITGSTNIKSFLGLPSKAFNL